MPNAEMTIPYLRSRRFESTLGERKLYSRQTVYTSYLTSFNSDGFSVKDLEGAVEIHHAVDDTDVSVEYSRNLMTLLDATRIPHRLFEYPSGGHNISGLNFSTAMQRTVEFFQTYLQ